MSSTTVAQPDEPRRWMLPHEQAAVVRLRRERDKGPHRRGRHTPTAVDEIGGHTVPEIRAREGADPIRQVDSGDGDAEETQPLPRRPRLRAGVIVGDLLSGDGPHDPDEVGGGFAL